MLLGKLYPSAVAVTMPLLPADAAEVVVAEEGAEVVEVVEVAEATKGLPLQQSLQGL